MSTHVNSSTFHLKAPNTGRDRGNVTEDSSKSNDATNTGPELVRSLSSAPVTSRPSVKEHAKKFETLIVNSQRASQSEWNLSGVARTEFEQSETIKQARARFLGVELPEQEGQSTKDLSSAEPQVSPKPRLGKQIMSKISFTKRSKSPKDKSGHQHSSTFYTARIAQHHQPGHEQHEGPHEDTCLTQESRRSATSHLFQMHQPTTSKQVAPNESVDSGLVSDLPDSKPEIPTSTSTSNRLLVVRPKVALGGDLRSSKLFNKQKMENNKQTGQAVSKKRVPKFRSLTFTDEGTSCQRSSSYPLKQRATIDSDYDARRRFGSRPMTDSNVQFRPEDCSLTSIGNSEVYKSSNVHNSSNSSSGFNEKSQHKDHSESGGQNTSAELDTTWPLYEETEEIGIRGTVVEVDDGDGQPDDDPDFDESRSQTFVGQIDSDPQALTITRSSTLISPTDEEAKGGAMRDTIEEDEFLPDPNRLEVSGSFALSSYVRNKPDTRKMSWYDQQQQQLQHDSSGEYAAGGGARGGLEGGLRWRKATEEDMEETEDGWLAVNSTLGSSDTDSGRGSIGRTGSNTSNNSFIRECQHGIIYENGRPPSGKTTSSTDDPAMPEGYEGLEKMSEERKNTILTDNSIPMFQGTENTNNPTPVSPTVLTTQQSLATITTERNSSGGNGRRSLRQERFKKPAATVDDDFAQERGGTVRESDSFSTGSRSSTRENSPADRYSSDWDSSGRGSTMATSPGSLARNNRKKSGICRRPTLMVKQTLWVERDEVKERNLEKKLSETEVKLNEAMYEIYMTENSYYKHLGIAIDVFLNHLEKMSESIKNGGICSKYELHKLFSNMRQLHELSDKFITRIQHKQGENVIMQNFMPDLTEFLTEFFPVPYRAYASKRAEQEKTLKKLLLNKNFVTAIDSMRCDPRCQNQDLKSYLCAPIQKITRFHLLVEKVVSYSGRLAENGKTPEIKEQNQILHSDAEKALSAAKKLAHECNNADLKMRQIEQVISIQQRLDIPSGPGAKGGAKKDSGSEPKMKLMQNQETAKNCFLLKEGELTVITGKGTIAGLRSSKAYCFLFNEYMLMTNIVERSGRFLVRQVATDISVNRSVEFLKERYSSMYGNQPRSFWLKCVHLSAEFSCEAKMVAEDTNICEKLRDVGKPISFLLQFNVDHERERWADALGGTSNLMPTPVGDPLPKGNWYKTNTSYDAKEPDELTVYLNNNVRTVSARLGNWAKCVVLNEKLSVGWLPTEILVFSTDNGRYERKLKAQIETMTR